ncbi:Na+/H+ antiporter NhaA [Erwinia tracheiphila]|uniref:Na(+)/H(+) antiporter NhaA n=1 Tax=Erwinia tracheiphila TaxID=65700 RepID=A0A0M2K9U8_9GAMM|nr:Na+/H+ antiporter NhaA [Erwinia tracheiphila]AXF77296.1 Na+/H+ antiporter NhaA [Erwinia tracheiphila]EOS95002.1 pH-dependent sodium/proton antiporter [Erwinia tracheiphila PSU-1]KKF36170.1 pH-dependent sodium/proton antiporter [Erwinia tracheiphila]UIA84012.1 Na+/H+ antiporter NhaA [Erwinia tracheiphila]UIA87491.1 Na+/H+ antiporter NhaA [Erwinia tracheiphila]
MKSALKRIIGNEATGGVILILAAMAAMVMANNAATQQSYQTILTAPVELRFGALDINKNVLLWINDALMALFFLMIGLAVKQELVSGSLASRQRAMFPLIAAVGGMIAPGAIFALLNHSDALALRGWAIPTATDIAFALGILALLGSRIPPALKIFLMALAVIDDLGAILIIAFFYTQHLAAMPLCYAVGAVMVLALLNRCGVRNLLVYMLPGIVLWIAILKSGVHATLAGVIVGFFIPLTEQKGHSPATHLAHSLAPWVSWLILPLFAFANAGVSLSDVSLGELFMSVPLGIIFGLFIGKPLGIALICWLAVKLRIAALPRGTQMGDIVAIGVLCGIGFTMSIFIASLAFDNAHLEMIKLAKLGILTGSVISAVVGYTLLRLKFR